MRMAELARGGWASEGDELSGGAAEVRAARVNQVAGGKRGEVWEARGKEGCGGERRRKEVAGSRDESEGVGENRVSSSGFGR